MVGSIWSADRRSAQNPPGSQSLLTAMRAIGRLGVDVTPGARVSALALAFGIGMAGLAVPALAQQGSNVQAEQNRSLGQRVFSRGLPQVARYVSASNEMFTLDITGARPLIQYEGSDQIFLLRAHAAPRGDVVYRNEAGETVLRISRDGGLTAYTESAPAGSPVFYFGEAQRLRPQGLSPAQLSVHLTRQSRVAGLALERNVFFVVANTAGSELIIAETATLAANTLAAMALTSSREAARAVRRVEIIEGARPDAAFANGVLRLIVRPDRGAAGRPSSTRIQQVIEAG